MPIALDFVSLPYAPMNNSKNYEAALQTCFQKANEIKTRFSLLSSEDIQQARQRATAGIKEKSAVVTKEWLTNYYRCLDDLREQLPKDFATLTPHGASRLSFRSIQPMIQDYIHHEMAMTLLNLAAFLSKRALPEQMNTRETRSSDARLFQEAAAVLEKLQNMKLNVVAFKEANLSDDFLNKAKNLMLAQAQERTVWNAIEDRAAPTVIASCAKGASTFYRLASSSSYPKPKQPWTEIGTAKDSFFEAISHYYCQLGKREGIDSIGEIISRLRRSQSMLEKLKRKRMPGNLKTHVSEYLNATTRALEKAKGNNRNIYQRREVDFRELQAVPEKRLARLGDCSYLERQQCRLTSAPSEASTPRCDQDNQTRPENPQQNDPPMDDPDSKSDASRNSAAPSSLSHQKQFNVGHDDSPPGPPFKAELCNQPDARAIPRHRQDIFCTSSAIWIIAAVSIFLSMLWSFELCR